MASRIKIGDRASRTNMRDACVYGGYQTDDKIYFRDTGIYLQSSSDGVLNIVSDTTLAFSGKMTTDGTLTMTFTDEAAPIVCTNTMTTAGKTGCRFLFNTKLNVAAGGWINAIKGYLEFTGTSGRTTGLASAVNAEVLMPNAATTTGGYTCYEANMNYGTNTTAAVGSAFMRLNAGGTTTNFLTGGLVFSFQGLGDATTQQIFQANTAGDASHALRIQIGTTDYYIMLTSTGA